MPGQDKSRSDQPRAAYGAERDSVGTHEIAVLEDFARGRRVRIARRGATVISLEQTLGAATLDLADGYRDAAELDSRPSSRFAIMVPFANRIDDARYTFDGESHDLQPGVEGPQRAARHGFVRGVDFELAALGADELGARAEFRTSAIRPDVHPGYPFAIDLSISYLLDADGLTLEASMRNVGERAAPCFFGWHPYFRLDHAPVDSWELQIPAGTIVRTDAAYIPLPGAAAHVPMQEEPALDFRRPRPIGVREINHAYAQLRLDEDGRARTHLRDPDSGLGLAVWQESGVMLAFTADTVTRDVRRSVALEPMESWADAFNRADCFDAIRLEPGTERRFRCGVEIELP
ncbi:aldose epimerase [Dyella marensis]|uniref:Aldose 1-epimerase n=1 Tax=Dyella marensis TaxID=500610 RepID=A0A1I2JFE2_9GAMM|nr:aldose epimerase [Dyella japonica]SFF51586.1 aldose 1-epimerase [Dyella marensis]